MQPQLYAKTISKTKSILMESDNILSNNKGVAPSTVVTWGGGGGIAGVKSRSLGRRKDPQIFC